MENSIENQEVNMTSESNNQTGQEPTSPMSPKKDGGVGPVIGSVIIILVILVGGLYYLDSVKSKMSKNDMMKEETATTTDDIDSLEAGVDEINLDEINSSLDEVDAEIDAAIEG